MARPLRIEYPGAVYHITARGNERKKIFRDNSDYLYFLKTISDGIPQFNVKLFAYALMPNHYHILIQTLNANLSKMMHQLNTTYTLYFNQRYNRAGHLFQGRYHAILVQQNRYLLEVSRYLHLNAYRARIVNDPLQHTWSTYRYYVGASIAPNWLTTHFILDMIDANANLQKQLYQRFVNDGMTRPQNPFEAVYAQTILGDSSFIDEISSKVRLKKDSEIPAQKKFMQNVTFEKVLDVVSKVLNEDKTRIVSSGRFSLTRKIAIYFVRVKTDMSLKDIGRIFNISYSAVAQLKKSIDQRRQNDNALR